jgi:hypothetical protein
VVVAVLMTVAALAALPAAAAASRAPTVAEEEAIRAALLADCDANQEGCVFNGAARVSTVDQDFAWAAAHGDYYDHSGILRFRDGRWTVQIIQGGGVRDCRDFWQHASTRVVHDLRISGLMLDPLAAKRCSASKLKLRRCGTIAAVTEGVQARERITSRGVRCRKAKRIIHTSNSSGRTPPGWGCIGSGEGATCARTTAPDAIAARRWALPYTRSVQGRF